MWINNIFNALVSWQLALIHPMKYCEAIQRCIVSASQMLMRNLIDKSNRSQTLLNLRTLKFQRHSCTWAEVQISCDNIFQFSFSLSIDASESSAMMLVNEDSISRLISYYYRKPKLCCNFNYAVILLYSICYSNVVVSSSGAALASAANCAEQRFVCHL